MQRLCQNVGGSTGPAAGRAVFARVGPRVAVVEVEQKRQPGILDSLAECLDVFQVLANAFFLMLGTGLRRIDKQADTHGIPSLLLEVLNHVAGNVASV